MSPYKIILFAVVALLFGSLAIRIKGKILLLWAVILLRYNLRPRYYVFNKNDTYLRDVAPYLSKELEEEPVVSTEGVEASEPSQLSIAEVVRLQDIVANPKANLKFITDKKGALRVHLTEIK